VFVQCDSLWTKREETAFHGTFQIFDFFSNLIGAKVIHQRESGQSSGLYFSGATKGRVREPRTKKSWTPVSRDWPSLVAFANFFLAGRVHKPTMKVNIISRSDPVGRRSKQTANVVTRVGSKTCFVRFQTGNTSFFSDRVAVPDRERKWALCLCIRDLGCCSDEFKRNLNENNDGNVGPITRRVGSHDDALRRIVGATLPSGSVRYRPANQRRTAADTGSHRAAFGVASVTREFLLFPSAIC